MGVIDVSAGFPQACREKAALKLEKIFGNLSSLSDEDRFAKLQETFALVSKCADQCLDNFQPGEFESRENAKKSDGQLEAMIEGALQGVLVAEGVKDAMGEMSLSHVNGTSVDFMRCSKQLIEAQTRAATAVIVYNNHMARRSPDIAPAA
jgi:hypothetical protein